jgi:hypothetical protein
MKEINKFYKWFNKCGGVIPLHLNLEIDKLNYIQVQVSSFKHRASEVKELFNYKFKTNLNNFPNVNDLTFERK